MHGLAVEMAIRKGRGRIALAKRFADCKLPADLNAPEAALLLQGASSGNNANILVHQYAEYDGHALNDHRIDVAAKWAIVGEGKGAKGGALRGIMHGMSAHPIANRGWSALRGSADRP
jgi:hypothetical protein